MEHLDLPLPPKAEVRAALQRTTLRLAEELREPQASAPQWSEFEWRVAMAVASMHGITGLLAERLHWRGHEVWQAFLAEQRAGTAQRLVRVRALLGRLDAAAREAGIAVQILKGSALIEIGLYAPGTRPMSDVDLLVRPEQFEMAGALIERLGYEPLAHAWKHREYIPVNAGDARAFGEHDGNPVKIDLHSRVAERLPRREVDITGRISRLGDAAGLASYPSMGALMLHLLIHASGNLCVYCIRLIHLHDIAKLAPRLAPQDWVGLFAGNGDWWLYPVLRLVDCSFPARIPAWVLERAASVCPQDLRRHAMTYRIEDVSISRFSAPALPGIEWVDSPREALAYLKTRLYPGREASREMRRAQRGHAPLQTTAWGRMPRWQRALHWIGGHPPRAITMYSVQRALQHCPSPVSSV